MLNIVDYTGKKALIGGADDDIGRAIALRMAQEGMKLALVGRDAEKLIHTAALTGRPLDMLVLPADFEKPRAIQDILRILTGHFKVLDLLVNCFNASQNDRFEDIPEADFNRVMTANVKAPFLLCQKSLPLLRLSECPTIINIGATLAGHAALDASARALEGMTNALAREVETEGIRVHMISCDIGLDAEEIADMSASLAKHRRKCLPGPIQLHRVNEQRSK